MYWVQSCKTNRKNVTKSSLTFLLWMGKDVPHTRAVERLLAFFLHVLWQLFLLSKSITDLTNPWWTHGEFFICKKSWGEVHYFFLPTVEGISWINQTLKTTVVKCHAEDSCKELNCNVTNNHLQQLYWHSRHHIICPARPVPTTTGLNGMFLPVQSPEGYQSGKCEVTQCELSQVFLGAFYGDNAQLWKWSIAEVDTLSRTRQDRYWAKHTLDDTNATHSEKKWMCCVHEVTNEKIQLSPM